MVGFRKLLYRIWNIPLDWPWTISDEAELRTQQASSPGCVGAHDQAPGFLVCKIGGEQIAIIESRKIIQTRGVRVAPFCKIPG